MAEASSEERSPSTPPAAPIRVSQLVEFPRLAPVLRLDAGAVGLDREIGHPRIQKSGLALAGHMLGIVPTRVQVLGETEISFLEGLDSATRRARVDGFFAQGLSAVVVTRGVLPLAEIYDAAERAGTPLLVSTMRSSMTINAIHFALDRLLAPTTGVHGVLVDVFGLGMLLRGPSAIGKSECALFLVERGHRFVADDRVQLMLRPSGVVLGVSPPLIRHHLEVRGIGILNMRELFGATSVRDECPVDLVVELCPFRDDEPYERLGLDDLKYDVLGVSIPMLRIPVRPGRNMAVLLEVAARNQLLKRAGHHSARDFAKNLAQGLGLARETTPPKE